jgi:protein-tyrosine phosphatase
MRNSLATGTSPSAAKLFRVTSRGRVELHFHILPGVDDGPVDLDDSIELARAAVADGTELVVATPHVRPDWPTDVSTLPDRVRELRAALARERIPLGLLRGAELGHQHVARLDQRELELIAAGTVRGALAAGRDAVRGDRRELPRRGGRAA